MTTTILVTGSTGTIGKEVVRALLSRGFAVRLGLRDPSRAVPRGATAVRLDWADATSFEGALAGVDRVFLLTPFIEDFETPARAFVAAAARAGVTFLVKLSAAAVAEDAPFSAARQHAHLEKAVTTSGSSWALLRPTFFMDNVFTFQREVVVASNEFHGASGGQPVAYVSSRDVGEVAAAVLADPTRHSGRTYELTGAPLRDAEVAAALSLAAGRPIRYVDHTVEEHRASLVASGAPGWVVEAMNALEGVKRQGWASTPSSAVAELLGRPPETFTDFAARQASRILPALTHELYDAFQRVELDRWDAIIAPDVLINSPVGRGITGLVPFKQWAQAFAGGLAYRIDLVDEHLALDARGDGRGFVTFTLSWKHGTPLFGLEPTGREGTSVETLLLTVRDRRITRIDVAANSVDLALYLWDRGWNHPHNVRPTPLVEGVDRSVR
jgi:uncharacterized protein YbjT (DUF2867 family)